MGSIVVHLDELVANNVLLVRYRLAAATPHDFSPRLEQARVLRHASGAMPSAGANDGIVPTRSQGLGHVLHAARADHGKRPTGSEHESREARRTPARPPA